MKAIRHLFVLLALAGFLPAQSLADPIPVDLELVLAIDVSGSIDNADFELQQDGYVAAFQSPTIQNAILGGDLGRIAINVVYFATTAQAWANGWMLIDSASSADTFATTLDNTTRPFFGGTDIIAALDLSATLFGSEYIGTRQVIDVSGDGSQNACPCSFDEPVCPELQDSRDAFLAGGDHRTINAIWIDDRHFFGISGQQIDSLEYGETNVIGGQDAFQLAVTNFQDFGDAIFEKLQTEISGRPRDPSPVPAPGTLALMGLGLLGIALHRRRRNS